MGLAAPRTRAKLSHDPNNTKWTRDTGGFGHKIMVAQGWQPGEYLGAKDAAHAEFHTAANASHIRVKIKDDNLGLGAKKGSRQAGGECTGLDVFQSLLGRLNGKGEDELAKEQKSREDLRRAAYTERRWGMIKFVKGGFLIGDKIQELVESEAERLLKLAGGRSGTTTPGKEAGPSESLELQVTTKSSVAKSKKSKKSKNKLEGAPQELPLENISSTTKISDDSDPTPTDQQGSTSQALPGRSKKGKSKKKRKLEKLAEELRRNPARSKKRGKEKTEDLTIIASTIESLNKKTKRSNVDISSERSNPEELLLQELTQHSATSTLLTKKSTDSHPSLSGGRHAVRARFIAQKRLAVLDTASLNEIFMIKK